MVLGDGTGCSGWSRLCDHAAEVQAVSRVLRAFGSVPRQNGGHFSCMQISVRTVHTVQQTVEISQVQFLGWLLTRLLLCNDRCPGWSRRKLWSLRRLQCLWVSSSSWTRLLCPLGATIVGRAMLASTMDTWCYPGWLMEEFLRFST